MYHRIMELLVLLMDEFGRENLPAEQIDVISEDLLKRGYTEQEIHAAFYWLLSRAENGQTNLLEPPVEVAETSDVSFRLLNTYEQRHIQPEAFGYLLQLLNIKLITRADFEKIIERSFFLDAQPVTLADMKMITQAVLFEDDRLWSDNGKPLGPAGRNLTYH